MTVLNLRPLLRPRWPEVAARVPGRNSKQVRDRFNNRLNPALKPASQPWDDIEDACLYHGYHKWGSHWGQIVSLIPGRSPNQAKNRFNSLCRLSEDKKTPAPNFNDAASAAALAKVDASEFNAPRCGTLAPRAHGARAPVHRDPSRPIGYDHSGTRMYLQGTGAPPPKKRFKPNMKAQKKPVAPCAVCHATGTDHLKVPCCSALVCRACAPDVACLENCPLCGGLVVNTT